MILHHRGAKCNKQFTRGTAYV